MFNKSVDKIYSVRRELIIVGLTGRTGSGCSTVAGILKREKFDELDVQESCNLGYRSVTERKRMIINKYMSQENHWKKFDIIEVSGLVLHEVYIQGIQKLIGYVENLLKGLQDVALILRNFDDLKREIKNLGSDEENSKKYDWEEVRSKLGEYSESNVVGGNASNREESIRDIYIYFTETIVEERERFKNILSKYQCEVVEKGDKNTEPRRSDLYSFLMQRFANNIRRYGNPLNLGNNVKESPSFVKKFIDNVEIVIRICMAMRKINVSDDESVQCRICIDAIRNPYEAMFLKDKFRSFYLVAINTEKYMRKKRLHHLSDEQIAYLDSVENPENIADDVAFYHQHIGKCIEIADIHLYNGDVENRKYYDLTQQMLKYIALMLHPGLVTPTAVERCMQQAYVAKLNSGCLSRQVGAVVTREDFSVQGIGWNDVPQGEISCNLRDVFSLCRNMDEKTFTRFEIEDKEFNDAIEKLCDKYDEAYNGHIGERVCGKCYHLPFCFKEIYNGIKGDKNQVHTRALHAEENAFLQVSKYGGSAIKGGYLFVTASPCELCSKKSYQLGIKKIYYIDPYPGIATKQILGFGEPNNPQMFLFYGAIGDAYIDLYKQRIPIKDEIALRTGVKVKEAIKYDLEKNEIPFDEIEYRKSKFVLDLSKSLMFPKMIRNIDATIRKNVKITKIRREIDWGFVCNEKNELVDNAKDIYKLTEIKKSNPYIYEISFDKKNLKKSSKGSYNIQFTTISSATNIQELMEPFLAHKIKNKIEELFLCVKLGEESKLIKKEDVYLKEYSDIDKKKIVNTWKIQNKKCNGKEFGKLKWSTVNYSNGDGTEDYGVKIKEPKIGYVYEIEWKWNDEKVKKK